MRKIASVSFLIFASVGLYSCAGAKHLPLADELVGIHDCRGIVCQPALPT